MVQLRQVLQYGLMAGMLAATGCPVYDFNKEYQKQESVREGREIITRYDRNINEFSQFLQSCLVLPQATAPELEQKIECVNNAMDKLEADSEDYQINMRRLLDKYSLNQIAKGE